LPTGGTYGGDEIEMMLDLTHYERRSPPRPL